MEIYWFGLAVYLNPLIWMYLYDKKIPISPKWVQVAGLGFVAWLLASGWSSGFYTNSLLILYTLMVVYVIHHYRGRPGFQSVCLAFLIVYVNSFFWEFPIHVADLMELDFGVVALQAAGHLYPVPFLLSLGFSIPRRWWYWSAAMWTVVALFTLSNMLFNWGPWTNVSLNFCRVLSLFTLLWVLRFPGQPESRIISTARQLCKGRI